MNPTLKVFFYSKYSDKCKEINNMAQNLNLEYVCLDNKKIREKVLRDKRFNIQNVPCILIFYDEGTVEKYEGANAFKWCDQMINDMNSISHSHIEEDIHEPMHEPVQQEMGDRPPSNNSQTSNSTSLSDLLGDDDEEEEEDETPKKKDKDDFSDFHRGNDTQVNNVRKVRSGNDENTKRPADEDIFDKDEGLGGGGESALAMAERMQREREKE